MQNDSIDNLRLDLNKKSVRGVIYVRVGDTRARTVHITLTSNGKVVDLSDAAICEILIRKPDGSQNDQATINEQAMVQYGNELQYTFRTQDINVPGECHCQVMVTFKDGAVVTSPDFSVMVYEKEVAQEYEQSTNEYTAITQQLIDVMELRNQTAVDAERAETARENIEDIEASCEVAKGQVEELTNRAETAAQSAEASAQSAADDLQATQNYRNEALNYKEETDINRQAVNDKAEEILSYEYQAQQYALSAEASATSASASESSAQTSAASAENDAISSRSYAKGGTGTRTGEDVDNSKYYYEQARDIAEGLQGALLPQGTITFAQLDNVTVIAGYEWNISDDFVSDSRFNDGGGVQYAAGTNVYVTADLKFDCLTGSAVTGVKGSAESTYRKGYVEIKKEDIGLGQVDNTPVSAILLAAYPVGSIYMSVNNVNPGTLFGGTWEAWGSGKVPVGVELTDTNFDTVEKTGGTDNESYTPQGTNSGGSVQGTKLTAAQSGVPAHAHGLNSHKHSIGAHKHGIPKLNVSSWTGSHRHTITMYGYQAAAGGFPQGQSKASTNAVDYDSLIANASITVSGQKTDASNTDNSTAFDSGAATGNTANNTAASAAESHDHGFTNPTFSGTASTISHLQPYITCYMWKRTA